MINFPSSPIDQQAYTTGTLIFVYSTATSSWSNQSNVGGTAFNGGTINNALIVNNSTASTSTNTGALTVAGGVGVGGDLNATAVYDNNKRVTNKATGVAYSMIFGGQ